MLVLMGSSRNVKVICGMDGINACLNTEVPCGHDHALFTGAYMHSLLFQVQHEASKDVSVALIFSSHLQYWDAF